MHTMRVFQGRRQAAGRVAPFVASRLADSNFSTQMSNPPQVRRTDRLMSEQAVREMITKAYSVRLATIGEDGWPYIVPLP